ncbi:MAG: DPP IV N-terminal domain-containing protein [Planctomycetota bacterium]
MMHRRLSLSLPTIATLSLLCALAARAPAQERFTLDLLLQKAPLLLPRSEPAAWRPGGHDLVLQRDLREGQALIVVRPEGGEENTLCTAAQALAAIGKPPEKGKRAVFPSWSFAGPDVLRLETGDAIYHWTIGEEKAVRALPLPLEGADRSRVLVAPGDRHVAFVRDHDLVIASADGSQRRITWDGSEDVVYGGGAHREEFGIKGGLFWSKDGSRLAFYREDQRPIAVYPYQDPTAVPPKPVHGRYPMAGMSDSIVQVGIYDVEKQELRWLESDPAEDIYWTNIAFTPDAALVFASLVNRGQDHMELWSFDASSGKRVRKLLQEGDPEWVEPEHPPAFLEDGRFLFWSSRSGFRHLWLCGADGSLPLQVTDGAFDVQTLLAVDEQEGLCWFQASGEDPRQLHLFSARLDGSKVRRWSGDRGTHRCSLSDDRAFALDEWSSLDHGPARRFLPLREVGATPVDLPPIENPLDGLLMPQSRFFSVKAGDGSPLYGHLLLPAGLDESRKYPLLLYVYGGPHAQLVTDSYLGGTPIWLAALANEGYVLCRLDNRGTPNRGIDFEQKIHRHLGTLEVEDQLLGLDYATSLPFVDPSRVGVHGWSFGGYMTLRLMLLAPDRFACGVSGAPVTDWRMYETGYTERYMDTPAENPDGYEQSSVLPLVGKLKGRLLLVQGTDDRTVMWSHTLQFADRAIDQGVLFDYFPYPMQQHGLTGRDRVHFLRMLQDHLKRWLRPAQ